VTGELLVNTVLNEFLHAIRDLIPMSVMARELREMIPSDLPPPHAHTLNKLADIWGHLETYGAQFSIDDGWRLSEAMNRLFEGRGETMGLSGSTHAVYQFYRTEEPYYRLNAWRCPVMEGDFTPETLTDENRALSERFFGPW
jgi:hypothetical protein